ncbi:hypothetical protein YC2023_067254 [Brassica napus]
MDVNVKLSLEGKAFEASSAILQAFEFKENLKLQQFMKLACILCTCTLAIFSQLRGKTPLRFPQLHHKNSSSKPSFDLEDWNCYSGQTLWNGHKSGTEELSSFPVSLWSGINSPFVWT